VGAQIYIEPLKIEDMLESEEIAEDSKW
jgi:hypothetical protein